jgi:hypothetical protein
MTSKYKLLQQELGFIGNANENTVLSNLLKKPQRDNNMQMPHTTNPTENGSHQIDTLYFTKDPTGNKYILVVVDLATRKTDAQPMKDKSSTEALKALKAIYKRKILKLPHYLECDQGTEFKGEFYNYFHTKTIIRYKESGRHRQQSVVETRNGIISRLLSKRQLAQEINTGEPSHEWVDFLPQVISSMNKYYTQPAQHIDGELHPLTKGINAHIIPVGTQVRTQLDNPISYLQSSKLHGKFRAGDIRWNKTPHPITTFFLRPNQPPMYQVNNNNNVAYTRNQLQIVKDEIQPSSKLQQKFIISKILTKERKKNKIFYNVKWSDNSTTLEPRSTLIKDVPQLIKEFDEKYPYFNPKQG